MGGLNVKNTMAERVLQIIAPHPCYGCGEIGSALCDYCKYDITHDPFAGCFLCGVPASDGVCSLHLESLAAVFTVSTRDGAVKNLIDGLKFSNNKSAATVLAELLHEALPYFPSGTVIVPIPTVSSHIRQRGYDHMDLIARHFARLRSMPMTRVLVRQTSTVQHTAANKEVRARQAHQAFSLDNGASEALKGGTVLVLDDIITSGATLQAAGHLLSGCGATVYGAALAYQPLLIEG